MPAANPDIAAPPHNPDAESALIGATLLNGTVPLAAEHITPADFYRPTNAALWSILTGVAKSGARVDPLVLRDAIPTYAAAAGIDPAELLQATTAAVDAVDSPANADAYANIIREKARLRTILYAAQAAVSAARDGERPDVVIDTVRAAMIDAERAIDNDHATVLDILNDALAEIDAAQTDNPLRTGYHALDTILGPLEPGNVSILGARPAMGKTALGLNIATNAATDATGVIFLSAEMPRNQLGRRLLSTFSGIRTNRLRRGTMLENQEWELLADAKRALTSLPMLIDDTSAPSLEHLRRSIRRAVDKHKARLVILDYLGLVQAPKDRTIRNRENEIGCISRGLKAIAKDFAVHILALAQLNRDGARDNRAPASAADVKPPTLTDLRDSGSQEQDADAVLLLHRPGYYTKAAADAHKAEVIIAKNRHGETGKVELLWRPEIQRFDNPAESLG